MAVNVFHRNSCRLCDSSNLELVVELAPIPLAEKYLTKDQLGAEQEVYPIDMYMCVDCGHVQLLDVIDSETLWDDYTYHSGQTKGIVEHFEDVSNKLFDRYNPSANSLVIDIGSNDGTFLKCFKKYGLRTLGIDPAKDIAEKATKSGIETLPHILTPALARKITEENGEAAIVTAFNVFAHADDMSGMTDSISLILASNGIFVFEVQYLLDIIDRMLLGTIFHEHMCHHSLKPMVQFLHAHGLELIDVERVTIQGGSIIGTVQHTGGPFKVSSSVTELLELEKKRKLDKPKSIKEFSTRLNDLKHRLHSILTEQIENGASIAGYGAARSGPTLIAQFDLGDKIEYIVDNHPQKVNKYTPGNHIPVLPTKELYNRLPDYVIILAWIHAKKIIANNKEYLDKGGHFIVCCPEVKVIDKDNC